MDSEKSILWSTNLTGLGSPGNDVVAVLQHTGNLVLTHGSSVLWQSFDYVTDTFLPEMVIGFNEKKRTITQLVSWKSSTDPSRGNFSYGFHPDTSFQLFTWRGTEKYWRARPMVDHFYENFLLENSSSLAYFRTFASTDEINLTFTISDDSVRLRFTLDYSGQAQLIGWNDTSQDWVTYVSDPQNECSKYGWCGPFGYCDNSKEVLSCKCLQGFEPKVPSEWNNGNFTAGCARKEVLKCGSAYKFVTLTNMKVPDDFVFMEKSITECEDECRRNCSCKAYAFSTVTFNNTSTPRCLVWIGELLDTGSDMQFIDGEDLYLRLADPESDSSHHNSKTRTVLSAIVVICIIIPVISLFFLWRFKTRIKGIFQNQSKGKVPNVSASGAYFLNGFSGSKENGVGDPEQHAKLQNINFESLVLATDNFSAANTLGQGGFGSVYKGKLPEGQTIAVKRLARGSAQGIEEYRNEVMLIAKLQHRNLVRLLGWCIEKEEKLLIYEYMPNKSLDYFLFDTNHETTLDWGKRFNIIKGIARALLYLHQDSRLRIIHRDLKASNILLDENMEPKVSDFGMARIFATNQDKVNTKRVVGTYGYMSPEYGMHGLFSVKSDVYSFGVLILEIVSGSRNLGFHPTIDFPNLLAFAWKLWSEGNTDEFIDESIAKSCLLHEVQRCIYVGLLCVQDSPDDRPDMSKIINMLENEAKTYSDIKQPLFTTLKMENIESINDVTNTTVQVR